MRKIIYVLTAIVLLPIVLLFMAVFISIFLLAIKIFSLFFVRRKKTVCEKQTVKYCGDEDVYDVSCEVVDDE